ncbi:hypothetical protein [Thermoflavimicrobium dichotomicum]|uniref:Uncharacterized protein n=1 Tax=Thermoflavimicrobium dichotomicum TaxID=46223 RepID=A0A1I3SHL0_9BACL|nr:hypothetical protein [Thermoflavimicrobium dichotomicum]SFJ57582.1 hypothetical protein SAMN05421852_11318 [Thermoflavimicrobium dichotomicum]
MSTGVLAVLSILILFILIYTGWFGGLSADLGWSSLQIAGGLLFAFFITVVSPVQIHPAYEIEPGIFVVFIIFLMLFFRVPSSSILFICLHIIFLGTILFMYHEVTDAQTEWDDFTFRLGTVCLMTIFPLCLRKGLLERLLVQVGALVYAYGLVLLVYKEVFQPLPIGSDDFLDTFWICLIHIMVFHYGSKVVVKNLRKVQEIFSFQRK